MTFDFSKSLSNCGIITQRVSYFHCVAYLIQKIINSPFAFIHKECHRFLDSVHENRDIQESFAIHEKALLANRMKNPLADFLQSQKQILPVHGYCIWRLINTNVFTLFLNCKSYLSLFFDNRLPPGDGATGRRGGAGLPVQLQSLRCQQSERDRFGDLHRRQAGYLSRWENRFNFDELETS